MCLISILPKGTKKDTEEVYDFIINGYHCNKQGSGFMYRKKGSNYVNVIKGFFELDYLINTLKKLELKEEDELIVHHRISTSGNVDNLNCHPFVVSKIHDEVIMTAGKTKKPCIVHNGVFQGLTYFRKYNDPFSDTYTFARHIISNKHILNIFKEDKEYFKKIFDNILYNSKFVILQSDKPMEIFGDFINKNGYLHSNDGYCKNIINIGGFTSHKKETNRYDFWNSWNEGYGMDTEISDLDNSEYEDGLSNLINKSNDKFKPLINIDKELDEVNDVTTKLIDAQSLADGKLYKKNQRVVLDNTLVKIDAENCFDFYYVDKNKWDSCNNYGFVQIYEMNTTYDDSMYITLVRKDSGKNAYFGFSQDELLNNTYYIPKTQDLKNAYAELLTLVTCPIPVSKTSIKKLDKLIAKHYKRTNFDRVMYHRMEKDFSKLSLIMYNKYLKENNILESVERELA